MNRRGFTLIELITVVAISAILLALVAIPVVQTFNLTRAAQGFASAQDRARVLIDQIVREIGNSAGVRDNSGRSGAIGIVVPGQDGTPVELLMESAKLDVIKPYEGEPLRGPSGAYINPDTGKEDPTLAAPKGQVTLPVAPGATLVRYFIGLRRPLENGSAGTYNNPYEGALMRRNSLADNLYVLYRAEVAPRIPQGGIFVVNNALFDTDPATRQPVYDDPYFFTLRPTIDYDPATLALTAAGVTKSNRINAWLRQSTIVTEISRYDMISAIVDRGSGRPVYDGNVPRILSLINFSPTRISSEPATGQLPVRNGEENPNSSKVGPDVFRTEYGAWTALLVRYWPSQFDTNAPWSKFNPWQQSTPYLVGRTRSVANQAVGFSIYAFNGTGSEGEDGTELFDIASYHKSHDSDPSQPPLDIDATFRFPFSYALRQADLRSGWYTSGDPVLRMQFVPFATYPKSGRIVASFPITEVGDGNPALPVGIDNRPQALIGRALIPNNDNTIGAPSATRWQGATLSPSSATSQINQRFNALWNDWDFIWGGLAQGMDRSKYCKRFIDLRFVPCWDGAPSPLHPALGFPRARIVPGSDVVMGPDQNPGSNYGHLVRYTRVAQRPVGPNQYYIQYVNQREPDWASLGFTVPGNIYDPMNYDATNPLQAILQPQYRAGYVELNSRYGEPLPDSDLQGNPAGNISVFYRFSLTDPSDVVAADYDSRQVMSINLTIRNFPQTTLPNTQTVTLKGSATVRNFLR